MLIKHILLCFLFLIPQFSSGNEKSKLPFDQDCLSAIITTERVIYVASDFKLYENSFFISFDDPQGEISYEIMIDLTTLLPDSIVFIKLFLEEMNSGFQPIASIFLIDNMKVIAQITTDRHIEFEKRCVVSALRVL